MSQHKKWNGDKRLGVIENRVEFCKFIIQINGQSLIALINYAGRNHFLLTSRECFLEQFWIKIKTIIIELIITFSKYIITIPLTIMPSMIIYKHTISISQSWLHVLGRKHAFKLICHSAFVALSLFIFFCFVFTTSVS